jgi:hypothetical protein
MKYCAEIFSIVLVLSIIAFVVLIYFKNQYTAKIPWCGVNSNFTNEYAK